MYGFVFGCVVLHVVIVLLFLFSFSFVLNFWYGYVIQNKLGYFMALAVINPSSVCFISFAYWCIGPTIPYHVAENQYLNGTRTDLFSRRVKVISSECDQT